MKASTRNYQQQSMMDILSQELDNIYYPGYTEELLATEPEKFDWELREFIGQFSRQN